MKMLDSEKRPEGDPKKVNPISPISRMLDDPRLMCRCWKTSIEKESEILLKFQILKRTNWPLKGLGESRA